MVVSSESTCFSDCVLRKDRLREDEELCSVVLLMDRTLAMSTRCLALNKADHLRSLVTNK